MKTKNNVQKTILTAIVILSGIAILNGNSSAQGFWGVAVTKNNSLAMQSSMNTDSKTKSSLESDVDLITSGSISFVEIEKESPLEVEEWMINGFRTGINQVQNKTEKKEVETKNFEPKVYSTKTFVYRDLSDPALNFEAWMFDKNHWKVK